MASVFSVLAAVAVYFVIDGKARLRNSLDVVSSAIFEATYTIQGEHVGASYVDLSAEYWLHLTARVDHAALSELGFALSDQADESYFKRVLQSNFVMEPGLDGYRLYRAELPLGEDTVCETTSCSLYLLLAPDSQDVFVGIYKS